MRSAYFDTSALVKLLVREAGSDLARAAWQAAVVLIASTLLKVEARAALAAAHRQGRLTSDGLSTAKRELATHLWPQLTIIEVDDLLLDQAADLAEQGALRAYDAVHLAAALAAGGDVLVTADRELVRAAESQGLEPLSVCPGPRVVGGGTFSAASMAVTSSINYGG